MKSRSLFLMILLSVLSSTLAFGHNQLVSESLEGQTTPYNAFRCTTFVYNLTTEEMKIRDICFKISLIEHFDFNVYDYSGKRDKTKDLWKYHIEITDNEKLTKSSLDASFYIFEENEEIIQYHCIVEDSEYKALIYNKIRSCWLILVLQNDAYKILSPYSGYRYVNAFDIKPKTKSTIDY